MEIPLQRVPQIRGHDSQFTMSADFRTFVNEKTKGAVSAGSEWLDSQVVIGYDGLTLVLLLSYAKGAQQWNAHDYPAKGRS